MYEIQYTNIWQSIGSASCVLCHQVLTYVTDDRHPSRLGNLSRLTRMVRNIRSFPIKHQAWDRIPLHLLPRNNVPATVHLFSTSARLPSEESPPATTPSSDGSSHKPSLTHLNQSGDAHMVSISSKKVTKRTATAQCSVNFSNPLALTLIRENRVKKGDVLGVARVAGIMAAKRTADLIPLCHPIAITHVEVRINPRHKVPTAAPVDESVQAEAGQDSLPWAGTGQGDAYKWPLSITSTPVGGEAQLPVDETQSYWVDISATVSCEGKTGVEMEALTAASVAALTVYDMCKSVDKGMRIGGLRVVRKEGGKSGTWVDGISVG